MACQLLENLSFNVSFLHPSVSPLHHKQHTRRRKANKIIVSQVQDDPSRTQRIMESVSISGEVGGAGGAYSYNALKRLDQVLSRISTAEVVEEAPEVVSVWPGSFEQSHRAGKQLDTFDVLVCGGTLGIFIATALSFKGLRVGIVERGQLKGRELEWYISRKEFFELVEVGILVEDDIQRATAAKFNPNRCAFEGKGEIWVEDILNLGVSPVKIIDIVKERFNSLGGVIFEGCSLSSLCVYDDAAIVHLAEGNILSSRLIIDAMGNFSPVVKQIRNGRKPDGICLAVGSCARGFQNNSTGDVIYSSSSVKSLGDSKVHYFWEAFPAGSGPMDRTTYMFAYTDPEEGRPKLEELLEDYWDLMPKYQFGDASGIQSPVSFGGFGSLTRHLERLSSGKILWRTMVELSFLALPSEGLKDI